MSSPPQPKNTRRRIFGLVLLATGVALAVPFGYHTMVSAQQSAGWPYTDGVIRESELISREQRDGSIVYRARIVYAYEAQGNAFEAQRVRFATEQSESPNQHQAEQWVEDYPPGRKVTVYYDPRRPSNAVLEPGARIDAYVLLGLGIVLMGIGGVLARSRTGGT